ncbi:MAG TPA: zincin-like metallopeptidase domain-containing protein [Pyrinomonadaceae bacterium]|nr:zincin-like metallopeptidase domain-containing protein [Pyrinomonadaceae bacterium]
MFAKAVVLVLIFGIFGTSFAQKVTDVMTADGPAPANWPLEKSQPIIDQTQTIRLAPDLSQLSAGERKAVAKLLEVGKIFQSIYENQRHLEALSSYRDLVQLDKGTGSKAVTQNLLTLYRLFQGPIATTLENKREPFLTVFPVLPGKNVYPNQVRKEMLEPYLARHPDKLDEILHSRTVVRWVMTEELSRDLGVLRKYPVLDTLHPGLRTRMEALLNSQKLREKRAQTQKEPDEDGFVAAGGFYAVPYSVAYADQLIKAHALLNEAADALQKDDEEFARYLRNRARDLLSDDYESGDAAWVTGHFKNLNAQIGSYETYDDELYGVKTFFAFSLLATRQQETTALRQAMKGLQALEDSLPYDHHKRIREDIPVGVYDVIADFGQARGGNTATILPNESYLARRYGRTILLRANIMREPNIFEGTSRAFAAAVGEDQAKELTSDGNFYRTLWHEVGHYLGVDQTKDGRDLDQALLDDASALEEMKADLVSLFVAEALHQQGYYTDGQLRSVYAGGILRVLQNVKPRRDQPYQTMQLMQWNFFLENGLLTFENAKLRIHYDRYHSVVGKLLQKVLAVQYAGDKTGADQFIDQYTTWKDDLHGVIAKNMREQSRYRFRLFKYAALGE